MPPSKVYESVTIASKYSKPSTSIASTVRVYSIALTPISLASVRVPSRTNSIFHSTQPLLSHVFTAGSNLSSTPRTVSIVNELGHGSSKFTL
ncbi:hypothetical protein [Winogradskyella sp.]|uniref:hypothetical protein n=1 Tax=Winogradskyella sp. TaxID=1883156 RepID=UPI0025DD6B58|nr:hypothetical protein [Winogradskyella sp.]